MHFLKKLFLLTLLILLSSLLICQQHEQSSFIDVIQFEGNARTKAAYLQQNILSRPNTTLTTADITYDIQLLRNLPSIADVSYEIKEEGDQSILSFIISERKTQLPILHIGGVTNNIWLGLGLIENNFRQRGNTLLAYYQLTDGRHSAEVFYKNQRTLNGIWGYTASLRKWSSNEPLFFPEGTVQYLYDNNSVSLSLIRNFGLRSFLELGGSLFRESYVQAENQVLSDPPGPNDFSIDKYLTKFQASHNQLFYSFFYLKGYSFNLVVQNVYNFDDRTFFNSFELAAKYFYRPREKLNLASQVRFAISTNNDSPFAPFVVDSRVNLRGAGNRIDRGTAQVILNLEARRTLYHKKEWSSQFVLFSDFGTWRKPGGELNDLADTVNIRHFIGGGFRLAYQKVFGATFRLDYGVDIYDLNTRGLVFGLGQYF